MTDPKPPAGTQPVPESKEGPFFTVVIPTMNRPDFLEATLETVLWQTFKNFEVIVSDNSNSPGMAGKSQAIVRKHSEDPRARYIRPDNWLNMPDHWEFATRQARGTYVLVLADRRVMRPSALQYLHSQIQSAPPGIGLAGWREDCNYSELSGIMDFVPFKGGTKILDTKQLLAGFAKFEDWKQGRQWSDRIPHTLNSCFRSDLAQKVREIYGRIFTPVSPDFMASFLLMAHTPASLYLDRPLYIQHSGGFLGNGSLSFIDGVEKFVSTFPGLDGFGGTPIPLNTLFNTLARDFLAVRDQVGEKMAGIEPDWVGYYVSNYWELIQKERAGSGMDFKALYLLWGEGVSRLPREKQVEVQWHVENLRGKRAKLIGLRKFVRKRGLAGFYSVIIGKLKNLGNRMAGLPVYDTVLEAARRTDGFLAIDRVA